MRRIFKSPFDDTPDWAVMSQSQKQAKKAFKQHEFSEKLNLRILMPVLTILLLGALVSGYTAFNYNEKKQLAKAEEADTSEVLEDYSNLYGNQEIQEQKEVAVVDEVKVEPEAKDDKKESSKATNSGVSSLGQHESETQDVALLPSWVKDVQATLPSVQPVSETPEDSSISSAGDPPVEDELASAGSDNSTVSAESTDEVIVSVADVPEEAAPAVSADTTAAIESEENVFAGDI